MRKIIHEIINHVKRNSWNLFREVYNDLSFEELKYLNNIFYELHGIQAHFNTQMMREIFDIIYQKQYKLRVVELGPYQGQLADILLKENEDRIEYWVGYDLSMYAMLDCVVESNKYGQVTLNDYFHNTVLPEFDVFVSTHTLEHMNGDELHKTIHKVKNTRFIVMEIPLPHRNWASYGGSHVLLEDKDGIKNILTQYNYEMFYDTKYSGSWWVSAWEKI